MIAARFFATAVRLDPTFARAHAGLSFTHFQNAFQGWATRESAVDRAFDAAGQSIVADERDPAAHWAMGRALWLGGRHDPRHHGAGAGDRPQPELRHGPLRPGLRPLANGRSVRGDRRRRLFAPAQPLRSACCSACSARAPWRSCGSADSRKPPTGASRRPPARTRTRISWRSARSPWRSPAGSTRRAATSPSSGGHCRTTPSTILWSRCGSPQRVRACFARPPGRSMIGRRNATRSCAHSVSFIPSWVASKPSRR